MVPGTESVHLRKPSSCQCAMHLGSFPRGDLEASTQPHANHQWDFPAWPLTDALTSLRALDEDESQIRTVMEETKESGWFWQRRVNYPSSERIKWKRFQAPKWTAFAFRFYSTFYHYKSKIRMLWKTWEVLKSFMLTSFIIPHKNSIAVIILFPPTFFILKSHYHTTWIYWCLVFWLNAINISILLHYCELSFWLPDKDGAVKWACSFFHVFKVTKWVRESRNNGNWKENIPLTPQK